MADPEKPEPKADETKPNPKHIRSPKAFPKPAAGDPPMHSDRVAAYRDEPTEANHRFAAELLKRTGPLVLDGIQYRLDGDRISSIPVEFLGLERQKLAEGLDKLNISKTPGGDD